MWAGDRFARRSRARQTAAIIILISCFIIIYYNTPPDRPMKIRTIIINIYVTRVEAIRLGEPRNLFPFYPVLYTWA